MKIIYFGTSQFAAQILTFILQNNISVLAVVTKPDYIRGKKIIFSPVKEAALKYFSDDKIFQPEKAKDSKFIEKMRSFNAELFVVCAYGKILSQDLLDAAKIDCINVHASLLPKYRGASPIRSCLMNGDNKTGITIMRMVQEMDAGEMLSKGEIALDEKITFGELEQKLCDLSKPLLLDAIFSYEKGEVKKTKQDESQVTFAPKIGPEEEKIDWNKSADQIHNKIRAMSPKPGARCFCYIDGEKKWFKILLSEVVDGKDTPGKILLFEKNFFVIACKEKAIRCLKVQLEGKKPMAVSDFIRGMRKEISFI